MEQPFRCGAERNSWGVTLKSCHLLVMTTPASFGGNGYSFHLDLIALNCLAGTIRLHRCVQESSARTMGQMFVRMPEGVLMSRSGCTLSAPDR